MREINSAGASKGMFRWTLPIAIGALALDAALASWYTVDQGERAVVLRMGAIVGEAGPGLHFKVPWVDAVHMVTLQNQNRRYMPVEAYSRDQQPANLTVSVSFSACWADTPAPSKE